MKKTISILITVLLLVTIFTGCHPNNNGTNYINNTIDNTLNEKDSTTKINQMTEITSKNETIEIENNIKHADMSKYKWHDYTVAVEDVIIQLPIAYSDFYKTTGYGFDYNDDSIVESDHSDFKVEPHTYGGNRKVTKNGKAFIVGFVNDTDEEKTFKECKIYLVMALSCDPNIITFPYNISIDTDITQENIEKLTSEKAKRVSNYDNGGVIITYEEGYATRNFILQKTSEGGVSITLQTPV